MAAAVAAALAMGCASVEKAADFRADVVKRSEDMRTGPSQAPRLTETSFAPALRCMDILFMTYGVKDLVVLVEDIPDRTMKVNAGGKDMIISAVSQMTRRSRAVRLIAFSASDNTLREVLERLAIQPDQMPSFVIRGSVSQFDESMVRKQGDAGLVLGPLSGGAAKQAGSSLMGLDLNMIGVPSLALIPGVTSKNSVLVMREGVGADAELELKKFGMNFNFSLARSEGNSGALRALAELATIELFGKLAYVPYWTCLGTNDRDPAVQAEISDWWETLVADPPRLFRFLQTQMKARGIYEGELNGVPDEPLLGAVQIYQRAMGLPANAELDFDFFKAYLATDHVKIQKAAQAEYEKLPASAKAAAQPAAAQAQAEAPKGAAPQSGAGAAPGGGAQPAAASALTVASARGPGYVYRRGEAFQVDVAVDRDLFLYCYLVDENRKVNQFFPNPVQTSPAVKGGTRLSFPGNLPFRFVANSKGMQETVACFGAPATVGTQPLAGIQQARDIDELASAFQRVAGPRFVIGRYDVKVQ
jgi:hypothetical protein